MHCKVIAVHGLFALIMLNISSLSSAASEAFDFPLCLVADGNNHVTSTLFWKKYKSGHSY